ncbi:hypothetical protein QO179_23575 [Bacillus stercoris]|nr:hypothetical protein [Bacillus stercoris]
MTLYGDLRDFGPSDIDGAVYALKDFLAHLNKSNIIENATFLIECDSADYYHTIVFAKGRVRSQKIVVKTNN